MNKRRISRSSLIAVGLAVIFALPVHAGSGSYVSRATRNQCSLSGGSFGYGFGKLNIYMEENTRSVNYFKLVFRVQQLRGGTWRNINTQTKFSTSFPANNTSYLPSRGRTWSWGSDATRYFHRITATVS